MSDTMSDPTPIFSGLVDTPFLFLGNDTCLDFLNTAIVDRGQPVDLLPGFDDLLRWLVAANLVDSRAATDVAQRWGGTDEATDVVAEARGLRARLLTAVKGLIGGVPPSSDVIDVIDALNAILQRRHSYERIVASTEAAGQWAIETCDVYRDPRDLLAPIAHAAAVLLCERDPGRVKACENPACVLHYYDTSKNGSRRWCDTRTCGNRIRVAQHYHRQHAHHED